MPKDVPAIPDMLGQSNMQGIVQPCILEENASNVLKGPILDDGSTKHRPRRPRPPLELSNLGTQLQNYPSPAPHPIPSPISIFITLPPLLSLLLFRLLPSLRAGVS